MDDNEIRSRALKYISGMKERLSKIGDTGSFNKVIELARQYTEDAEYYLEKGDLATSLVDVVYAEGLLDSINFLTGKDESEVSKKVFVGGTFDILHPGHVEFLKEASKYGRVFVSVARDDNSEKVKGRKPINDENTRLAVIKGIRYVHDAFLGDSKDFLKSVERVNPDIIFLGPDQRVNEEELKKSLKERGINVEVIRLKERVNKWTHSSSSQIIKEIVSRYCDDPNKTEGKGGS
ncbi:DUF357 domain-containing protein [Sulfuracidifex tepidarius]|uniref:FAD synthase n=1 Tax=Sulfuracidifex tepidarius TaxID=1294262 RepID=A0A510E283_9CREN|nr:DUF357 domain-containing protein [Sulfuracidifex tepidarius]BBG23866.1 FAD synthase [Sulfuracidifex tepidarius]BBG26621.1 FAD synthase [Sulfuracidifex tepidarius]